MRTGDIARVGTGTSAGTDPSAGTDDIFPGETHRCDDLFGDEARNATLLGERLGE